MDALCVVRKLSPPSENPPPPSTQAPKLPELVRDVTIEGAKTEILASSCRAPNVAPTWDAKSKE